MSAKTNQVAENDANRVTVFDTTLRDGEQSPGCSMNLEEKIRVATVLEEMQVDVIEAGFPIASNGDFEAVNEIAKRIQTSSVAGLARATKKDIDRAWEAVKPAKRPRIHTFIATSDIHLEHKLRMSRDQVLDEVDLQRRAAEGKAVKSENVEMTLEDCQRLKVLGYVQDCSHLNQK